MPLTFNFADLLEGIAEIIPDKMMVATPTKTFTYQEVDRVANQYAHAFAKLGVKAHDHVGYALYNKPHGIFSYLGLLKLRAVPINLNYRYQAHEYNDVCGSADLVGILCEPSIIPEMQKVRTMEHGKALKFYITMGHQADGEIMAMDDLLKGASDARDFKPRKSTDHLVIYTGGTTGSPRGVVWQQEDFFYAALGGGRLMGDPCKTPDEVINTLKEGRAYSHVIFCGGLLVHGAGLMAFLRCAFTGGTCLLLDDPAFDADKALDLCAAQGAQCFLVIGDAMAIPLLDAFSTGRHKLDQLGVIASSGAIISNSVKNRLEKEMRVMLINNLGASETGHQAAAMYNSDGTIHGFALGENDAIISEDRKVVPKGDDSVVGFLGRKGHIPQGYYKDQAKTEKTFWVIDGTRWVIPGDQAVYQKDGMAKLLGRGNMCINSGGEKIFPEEVENAIKNDQDIADALVIGLDSKRWGQKVVAVVQLKEGKSREEKDIQNTCREILAGYKVPKIVIFTKNVPRHATGKPDYAKTKKYAQKNLP